MRTIEISHRTIIFTILFLIGLWILWQIKQIIFLLFVSFLLAMALKPAVDRLTRIKIPRTLAILFVYIILLGTVAGILLIIIPPLIDQTASLASRLPEYLARMGFTGVDQQIVGTQLANLGQIPANVLRFAISVFSNLVATFAVLVLAFYLLLEWGNLDRRLSLLFGEASPRIKKILLELERELGGWVRGELILMTIIGVATYVGLRLLNIHFALPLALLAGILEIVPNVGPVVAAVPAVIVGFTISPIMGASTAALYFLIQQVENSVIVPKVMEKSVGLPPLVILLSLGVGFELGGILGAILAVPVVLIIKVAIREFVTGWKIG